MYGFRDTILWSPLMLDILKINLKSKDLNSDHIFNDQPFHISVMSWLESMTRLESRFLVTLTRLESRPAVSCDDSTRVTFFIKWLDSSHIKWLVTRVRVIFRKSPKTCWQTLLVCTQRNEQLLVHWSLAGCLSSMLSALTVSPSGRISVCLESGVSSRDGTGQHFCSPARLELTWNCPDRPVLPNNNIFSGLDRPVAHNIK